MTIKFVKQDCWFGLHWKTEREFYPQWEVTKWYLCIVPCFPISWYTYKAKQPPYKI